MSTAYERLNARLREVSTLGSAASVLHWDEQTQLPSKGAGHRAAQVSLIARLCHEMHVAPETAGLLAEAEAGPTPPETQPDEAAANLREIRRSFDRAAKLPASLVEELSRTAVMAQQAWVGARAASDFSAFRPWLEKVLELKRQEAACVMADGGPGSVEASGPGAHPYDALLDEYEPGATAAGIKAMFDGLRQPLADLVGKIVTSGRAPRRDILTRRYPVEAQRAIGREAAAAVGFDFDAGRLDVSVHPFCTGLGPGDTRLTTRYDEHEFSGGFFGTLHETGHGLYEQGLPEEHFGTPLGSDAGLGVHESQSRMWENLVGRSRPFWRGLLPKVRAAFPEALAGVTDNEWLAAVNDVRPSLIRTESDEVTYNLHVMLRFELELGLVSGDLPVADLPEAWNRGMMDLLGVAPCDDARGCLQDVHWSGGAIGYFPTYTLGNLYSAQLFEAARRDLGDLDGMLAAGEFAPLLTWLRLNVHRHGRRYSAAELIQKATGQAPGSDALLRHLRAKAGDYFDVR